MVTHTATLCVKILRERKQCRKHCHHFNYVHVNIDLYEASMVLICHQLVYCCLGLLALNRFSFNVQTTSKTIVILFVTFKCLVLNLKVRDCKNRTSSVRYGADSQTITIVLWLWWSFSAFLKKHLRECRRLICSWCCWFRRRFKGLAMPLVSVKMLLTEFVDIGSA